MILPTPVVDDRVGPKGTDIAAQFGDLLTLTYWDLWCLLAAHQKYQGDLELVTAALVQKRRADRFWSMSRRDLTEDLITLTEDLSGRLNGIGTVREVLSKLTERIQKKESRKAIENVLERRGNHGPSEPMLRSPRRLLEREALRGTWPLLPVDPTPIALRLSELLIPPKKLGHFPKDQTFDLAGELDTSLNRELKRPDLSCEPLAHWYAVFRAGLTLFHEKHCWDDSYGNMGEIGKKWVEALLRVTPSSIGAEPQIFLKDLLMFLCWENYGLSSSDQVVKYIFKHLSKPEQNLAVLILDDIQIRAEFGLQKYRADTAAQILKALNAGGRSTPVKANHLHLVQSEGPFDLNDRE